LVITTIVRSLLINYDDDLFLIIISDSILVLSIALAIIYNYKLNNAH